MIGINKAITMSKKIQCYSIIFNTYFIISLNTYSNLDLSIFPNFNHDSYQVDQDEYLCLSIGDIGQVADPFQSSNSVYENIIKMQSFPNQFNSSIHPLDLLDTMSNNTMDTLDLNMPMNIDVNTGLGNNYNKVNYYIDDPINKPIYENTAISDYNNVFISPKSSMPLSSNSISDSCLSQLLTPTMIRMHDPIQSLIPNNSTTPVVQYEPIKINDISNSESMISEGIDYDMNSHNNINYNENSSAKDIEINIIPTNADMDELNDVINLISESADSFISPSKLKPSNRESYQESNYSYQSNEECLLSSPVCEFLIACLNPQESQNNNSVSNQSPTLLSTNQSSEIQCRNSDIIPNTSIVLTNIPKLNLQNPSPINFNAHSCDYFQLAEI